MAKQDRRETGGAAMETITFHVHSRAADRRRHSRRGGTEPTSPPPHGAVERARAPRSERRDGQGSV
eukprot:6028155-Pleurochrysis_carterae.AAC.1